MADTKTNLGYGGTSIRMKGLLDEVSAFKNAADRMKPIQRNGINRSQTMLPVDHPDAQVGNIKVDGGANASYGDE